MYLTLVPLFSCTRICDRERERERKREREKERERERERERVIHILSNILGVSVSISTLI